MILLRSSLYFVAFTLGIVVFGTVIGLIGRLLPYPVCHGLVQVWGHYNRIMLAWICGLRDQIEGLEKLPPGPFVILCKHQSAWETVTMHTLFPPFVLVLKKSLMYIPFFGWALWATRQIPIDRANGVEAIRLLQEIGAQRLGDGISVLIFPEGTRIAAGETGKYNAGGVALAMRARVPIVPVAHNAGYFWPRNGFLKKPGLIRVKIGDPIPTADLDRNARRMLQEQVQERIETMARELAP